MDKEKELLSKEELALMRGGFGVEDVTVYALGVQDVNNCCNTTNNGGTTSPSKPTTSTTTTTNTTLKP